MTLNDIEKKASHFLCQTLITYSSKEINKRVLELLKICVENDIKLDLNEKDFVKIANMYYELYSTYDLNFLKSIADAWENKLDFYQIMKLLN